MQKKLEWCEDQDKQGLSTVPSLLREELSYNPFMRVGSGEIKKSLKMPESASAVEVMARLRECKNKGSLL